MDKQSFSLVDKVPNSIDLEKSLLGAILLDGGNYRQVRDLVNANDFVLPNHKTLFQIFEEIYKKDSGTSASLNSIIVLDHLKSNNLLSNIGGETYFVELHENYAPKATVTECAKRIKIKSTRRKLMELFVQAITKTKEDLHDTDNEIDQIISKINSANGQTVETPYKHISQTSEEFLLSLANPEKPGIKTGFFKLDEILGGLQKKQLITIAAETSMGKTTFAWNIAINAGLKKHPILYLSLEMSEMEMQKKAYSVFSGMSSRDLGQVTFIGKEINTLKQIHDEVFKTMPLYLTEQTLTLLDIKRTTRLMKSKYNIELLIVDHLHFMQSKKQSETRNLEISLITSELKALAKELNIAIIMLSQLNRAGAARLERRPMLTDLRDSGSIEQDSDIVIFIYRHGVHNPDEVDPSNTEIIVAKNRGGERNVTVELKFDGRIGLFTDPHYREEQEYYEEQQKAFKRQAYLQND